jgi:hypothetical protein
MEGPTAHLRKVHVGVTVLLNAGEEVGLEQRARRKEGQADGCQQIEKISNMQNY